MMIGASAGIAICPAHGSDYETLLMNADIAMFEAKRRGRGSYALFTPDAAEMMQERLTIEHDLMVAVRERRFNVHYQPKISCADGSIVGAGAHRHGARALVRLQDRRRGRRDPPGARLSRPRRCRHGAGLSVQPGGADRDREPASAPARARGPAEGPAGAEGFAGPEDPALPGQLPPQEGLSVRPAPTTRPSPARPRTARPGRRSFSIAGCDLAGQSLRRPLEVARHHPRRSGDGEAGERKRQRRRQPKPPAGVTTEIPTGTCSM